MPAYVIAGITGHVGSVVASELLARGQIIKAIVRDGNRGATWRDRGAEISTSSGGSSPHTSSINQNQIPRSAGLFSAGYFVVRAFSSDSNPE